MKNLDLLAMLVALITGTLIGATLRKQSHPTIPIKWDYAIDLQKDSIQVYTDFGKTIYVKHDGLDEFILKDNL